MILKSLHFSYAAEKYFVWKKKAFKCSENEATDKFPPPTDEHVR